MREREWPNFYKDDLDVLDLLKNELEFIESGAARQSSPAPWLPSSTFLSSPICINYKDAAHNHPCDDCLLMALVPTARRGEKVPCHHIPLTEDGKTVADLEPSKPQEEIEDEIKNWLRRMIAMLEIVRGKLPPDVFPGKP
jgi:hypothetical protein